VSSLLQKFDPTTIIQAVKDYWGVIALAVLAIVFLAFVFFRNAPLRVRSGIFLVLLVVAIGFGVYFLPNKSQPEDSVPEPKTATVYRNDSGTLFIQAFYDPPQLHRGETLCLEASTRESFDDVPRLLPKSEIESLSAGVTQGRLSYDPGDQPVWYRFSVTGQDGKPRYGKTAIAKRR
jgi:hypothetical protein